MPSASTKKADTYKHTQVHALLLKVYTPLLVACVCVPCVLCSASPTSRESPEMHTHAMQNLRCNITCVCKFCTKVLLVITSDADARTRELTMTLNITHYIIMSSLAFGTHTHKKNTICNLRLMCNYVCYDYIFVSAACWGRVQSGLNWRVTRQSWRFTYWIEFGDMWNVHSATIIIDLCSSTVKRARLFLLGECVFAEEDRTHMRARKKQHLIGVHMRDDAALAFPFRLDTFNIFLRFRLPYQRGGMEACYCFITWRVCMPWLCHVEFTTRGIVCVFRFLLLLLNPCRAGSQTHKPGTQLHQGKKKCKNINLVCVWKRVRERA